jgi:hypothetical protein
MWGCSYFIIGHSPHLSLSVSVKVYSDFIIISHQIPTSFLLCPPKFWSCELSPSSFLQRWEAVQGWGTKSTHSHSLGKQANITPLCTNPSLYPQSPLFMIVMSYTHRTIHQLQCLLIPCRCYAARNKLRHGLPLSFWCMDGHSQFRRSELLVPEL